MTYNTMVNRIRSKEQTMIYNDKQYNGQKNKIKRTNNDVDHCIVCHCKSLFVFLTIALSVIVNHCLFFWSHSFDHCVVRHCKSLFFLFILFLTMVNRIRSKEQTVIYNDIQHNGQKNNIKWTNTMTDNTMSLCCLSL
jgi:hypothetical protein